MGLVEILDAVELVFLRWHGVGAAEEDDAQQKEDDMEWRFYHGAKIRKKMKGKRKTDYLSLNSNFFGKKCENMPEMLYISWSVKKHIKF